MRNTHMNLSIRKWASALLASCSLSVAMLGASGVHAQTFTPYSDGVKLNQATLAGSHNTYNKKGEFEYFFNALDYVRSVEFDVWANFDKWYVNHDSPIGNNNNCPKSGDIGKPRNQDLRSCIEGLRKWHDRNPNHPLTIIKLEFKNGFGAGNSPRELDELVANIKDKGTRARIPKEWIFKPRDLMCKNPPACTVNFDTLENAARAGNWPTLGALRGKFMFVLVPGAAEFLKVSAPSQYARALQLGDAQLMFPSLLIKSAKTGVDPRVSYYNGDGNLMRWNVVFDMESGYLDRGEIPADTTRWMAQNNFLIFMTDSKPGTGVANCRMGQFRIQWLATTYGANVISTDQEKLSPQYFASTPCP